MAVMYMIYIGVVIISVVVGFFNPALGIILMVFAAAAIGGLRLRGRGDTPEIESTAQDDDGDALADKALEAVATIRRALYASGDAEVAAAGNRLAESAGAALGALAASPVPIPSAERALKVWLPAMAEASVRFDRLNRTAPDAARRAEVMAVLARVRRALDQVTAEAKARAEGAMHDDPALQDAAIA